MNSFITLLLETLGITEEQTVAVSKIMDTYGIKPCIQRDVLQPAAKGEKVGNSLVPVMQFKALESAAKLMGKTAADFKVEVVNGYLYFEPINTF